MVPKGIQNADAIIEACKETLSGLGPTADSEWREFLESVIGVTEDLKSKFFLKTNLAIPITNACRKDAAELQSLVAEGDLTGFPQVVDRFRNNMETLLKRAKMEGVIIT